MAGLEEFKTKSIDLSGKHSFEAGLAILSLLYFHDSSYNSLKIDDCLALLTVQGELMLTENGKPLLMFEALLRHAENRIFPTPTRATVLRQLQRAFELECHSIVDGHLDYMVSCIQEWRSAQFAASVAALPLALRDKLLQRLTCEN